MMTHVAAVRVFHHKAGSRERGQLFQTVMEQLNEIGGFEVSARGIRDRLTMLMRKHKSKMNKELKESGLGGGEPTEFESLVEDLLEVAEATEHRSDEESKEKTASNEADKLKALDIRQQAVERMGQTRKRREEEEGQIATQRCRRSGADTLDSLKEKLEYKKEMRMQEMKKKQANLDMQRQQHAETTQLFTAQNQQTNELLKALANQETTMQQQVMALISQQQQQVQLLLNAFTNKKQALYGHFVVDC